MREEYSSYSRSAAAASPPANDRINVCSGLAARRDRILSTVLPARYYVRDLPVACSGERADVREDGQGEIGISGHHERAVCHVDVPGHPPGRDLGEPVAPALHHGVGDLVLSGK